MNKSPDAEPLAPASEWLEHFCDRGYAVIDSFLSPDACAAIESYERLRWTMRDPGGESSYRPARVGRGEALRDEAERRDWIRWIDDVDREEFPLAAFFHAIARVREELRMGAMLPLASDEFHAAVYEAGAFYRKHMDVFRGPDSGRLVSCVFYLNSEWKREDGGAIRLYGVGADQGNVEILPHFNRLVIFQSREIPHEVLAPARERFSLTGWLKSAPSV